MATSGDRIAPYQSGGAGGKFRKRPSRRSIPATPYARPPTAVRNNKPSMLKKLVDPASRLIYAGAHRLFDVFRKNLPPLSLGPPEINEEPGNVLHKEEGNGNSGSISVATGISELELLLQQKSFTRSEIQRLTSVLHSKTTESPSDDSLEKHGDKRDNFHAAISTPVVTSRVLQEEIASPAELAKYYMGSRPSNQTSRPDSKLLSRTSMTPVAQKTVDSLRNYENGFATPRSRGRSAMYTMARVPYPRSPSNFSEQGVKSDYGHGAALTYSQGHEGKMVLKRRSSVLDDDIGSGGPLRRVRQKANLLSQRDKRELGYPVFQHLDGAGQNVLTRNELELKVPSYASVPTKSTQSANKILEHLDEPSSIEKRSVSTFSGTREKSPSKLRLDMLHGQALRSLEKVNSPKFLPTSHDIQKPVVQEPTLQSKDKTEEHVSRKFPVSHNMLTSVDGDMTDSLKDKAPIIEITDLPSKVSEEPQKKHSFQMSAPEDSFEMDDDDDDIHDNGHVLLPSVGNNNTQASATEIIKPSTLLDVSKTPELVELNKPMFSGVSKGPEQVELKEAESDKSTPKTDFGFLGGSVIEQGLGFKIPISSQVSPLVTTTKTSELTQSILQTEKMSPVKVSPFSFSANQLSEFKPNAGSDPKVNDSNSVFNSVPKNDYVKLSASNNEENGNINGNEKKSTNMFGKSESLDPAVSVTTSTNGIFSFGTSTKNVSTPNTTPAPNTPTFSSLAPSPASATAATTTTAISTTTTTTPAGIFSSSVSPQAFSFGSGTSTAPTTSVAETKSTSSPFGITTFAPTAPTTNGHSLFGFSSPAAATSTTTTTTTGNGLFGFSSSAAATSTSTTTGSGLFGFSSPAAATSTSTTSGTGLFSFGSPAAATSTTTTTTAGSVPFAFGSSSATSSTTATVSAPFSFSSSAAATSSTVTVSAPFGFSSPAAATSTTTTAPASGLFGFSSPAAVSSTTTGNSVFGFSSPAAASSTTATTGSGLFGFSSSATAPSTTASQSQGSFFNITNGFQASTPASSTSTIFGSSAPAFGSSTSFGINSIGSTSENKSGNSASGSTTSIFGSSWQQPQKSSGFGSTFTSSPSSSVFAFGASSTPTPSFMTAGASNSSFGGPSVFGNSTPVFGAVAAASPNNNNDQMSMEDSMAEDSMQTHSPISPFGQAPVSAPGFMFGSATPTQTPTPSLTPAAVPFSFGGQPQNQAAPSQNPFQSSSVEFNAGGGSFSLGSGGEKSNRRIVRVMKNKNRKK